VRQRSTDINTPTLKSKLDKALFSLETTWKSLVKITGKSGGTQ